MKPRPNHEVANRLEEVADLLDAQGANPFRVRAYRRGAQTLRELERPAHELLAEGGPGRLEELPGVGRSLARSIQELVWTGRLPMLERLRGESGPEDAFASVPGIGKELAHRIHEELGVETLFDLEIAAWDGRLERVPGLGRGRVQAVRDALGGRFRWRAEPLRPQPVSRGATPGPTSGRSRSRAPREGSLFPLDEAGVDELLDVDREYREKAAADRLHRIAPRRFNPLREAWLPILHTTRGPRHYTALFSNTARAHELGTTHDWLVIYRDDEGAHGRWTVVTARLGDLRGRRIVRGREGECRELYGLSRHALARARG